VNHPTDAPSRDMPAQIVFKSFDELPPLVGQTIAVTDWIVIDQERINRFAQATDDHQWIHLDEARATKESPYGGTIAHGFLTLSMMAEFLQSSLACEGISLGVNYGLNKVRFPAPVRSGSKIRAHIKLLGHEALPDQKALQLVWGATIEIEGGDKPACVAEMITRWYA
jgi:acyl dehydratase